MSLHRCTELTQDAITVNDQQVLNVISKEFTFIKYLGSGRVGHAFLLTFGPKEQMVMKIMPCNKEAENEIRTSCLMNSIQDQTGIFPMTYGWLSCSAFPEKYIQYITAVDFKARCVVHLFVYTKCTFSLE